MPIGSNATHDLATIELAAKALQRDEDIDLVVDFVPTLSTTDYAGLLGSMIKFNSSEYDIYMIDVVWPGQYADGFLDIAPFISKDVKAQHIQSIYNANYIEGKQVAVPYFSDYGILYYRTDLLQKYNFTGPPQTWDEMEEIMEVIVPSERK
ncbi:hypothetical protein HDU67_002180, partial [Dinochytrium kinnereticum]